MDPLSAGFFTSIGSAFKFAEVAWKIAEVGSENEVFVRAIQVVRSDLEEVERLYSLESVQQKLTSTPGKLPWIKSAILNTKSVLNEIGKWVERARVEQESTGSIKFDTRVRWVFSDHEKLLNRKIELSTCHQQLSSVLSHMAGLESAPPQWVSQAYGDHTHFDDILARHKKMSRSQASVGSFNQTRNNLTGKHNSLNDPARTDLYPSQRTGSPHVPGSRAYSNVQSNSVDYQTTVVQSPVITALSTPPGSPPPTYDTAVSIDPLIHGLWPTHLGSGKDVAAADAAIPKTHTSFEIPLNYSGSEKRPYRNDVDNNPVPELAGDPIVFSGTNSAGPKPRKNP
ncbi:hypothetical protein E8E13_010406 [Curvularia kusanoi]|uniref:Uncharacterized protein n=1 Tax=Curvularia kusanoi TaxID=90978 RepID=A0A9P4W807_CURKU|nr:hypothetical protein E8E13_010406 [Curvularia kusanoi]